MRLHNLLVYAENIDYTQHRIWNVDRNYVAPEVFIVDELEQPLADKHYQVDSTIELVCIVRHVSMISSAVYWLHGNRTLNFDMTRGGIR